MPLSEVDRRAIFAMCDHAIGAAGRTTVVMALRGSRAQKVQRVGEVDQFGHGHFAGRSEDDVLARIDTLIHEGSLRFEFSDGLPLLVYTDRGLAQARAYGAERWTQEVREQVNVVATGGELRPSFLFAVNP